MKKRAPSGSRPLSPSVMRILISFTSSNKTFSVDEARLRGLGFCHALLSLQLESEASASLAETRSALEHPVGERPNLHSALAPPLPNETHRRANYMRGVLAVLYF